MEKPPQREGNASTMSASLSMSSGDTSFASANDWFERFLDDATLPDDARADLLVVFEEVVVNVITHAYRGAAGSIEISAERGAESLTLTVCDCGPPFDPLAQPEPNLDLPVAQRPRGGLGIHLVKRLCDRIDYQRRGESNILVMTKVIR
jgi:serine/threonine-protein kinase RsbW